MIYLREESYSHFAGCSVFSASSHYLKYMKDFLEFHADSFSHLEVVMLLEMPSASSLMVVSNTRFAASRHYSFELTSPNYSHTFRRLRIS